MKEAVISTIEHEEKVKKNDEPNKPFTIRDALSFSGPEQMYGYVGLLSASICGVAVPGSAVLVSQLVLTMTSNYAKYQATGQRSFLQTLAHDVMIYGLCYLGGGVVLFVLTVLQTYCFKYVGEKLTSRLRTVHFTALCRQNIAFFDDPKHSTGALTADLSTHATKLAMMSGEAQGRVIQAVFTLIAAFVVSFSIGSWLLTCIMLFIFPLLIFGQVARAKAFRGKGSGLSNELAQVGAYATETLSNIRTVVAMGLERSHMETFDQLLEQPLIHGHNEGNVNGLTLGFSSFIVFATYAFIFWLGSVLVHHKSITFVELMRTLMAMMMSSQGVATAASFLTEKESAWKSGAAIVAIRDRPLSIDALDPQGIQPQTVVGKIEFQHVTFSYPTHSSQPVLQDFNLVIQAGQTTGFCGPSGGGKSTCFALLERFYDPTRGRVFLDEYDVKTLNLHWLRRQIGYVSQEPILFMGTIAENIAYGIEEGAVSPQRIEEAAKVANAHAFIMQFPDGYATHVGTKGEQLSGGQKQRIAIARAIVRNPSILLFDEATSALDIESEQVVQQAMNQVMAMKQRTILVVAHRLSTIQHVDQICVIQEGRIVEQGSHSELMTLNGAYKKMIEVVH